MTDHEMLVELAGKAQELDSAMKNICFRMKRTRKNLKVCTETCRSTNTMIGEINGRHQ